MKRKFRPIVEDFVKAELYTPVVKITSSMSKYFNFREFSVVKVGRGGKEDLKVRMLDSWDLK